MKRSNIYKGIACLDALAAIVGALKGDAYCFACALFAGILWGLGEYLRQEEEKNV